MFHRNKTKMLNVENIFLDLKKLKYSKSNIIRRTNICHMTLARQGHFLILSPCLTWFFPVKI